MSKNLLTLIILTMVMTMACAYGDELADRMTALGFVEAKPPVMHSKEWTESNTADEYFVSVDKEELRVRPREPRAAEIVFDAGKTKYIGVDHGEFGGGLYLNDYHKEMKPFFEGNIKALIPIGDDLYIVAGHGYFGGAVDVIRNYKTPSKPQRVTLLPEPPAAVLLDSWLSEDPAIIMVGSGSFMILEPDDQFHMIQHNMFWGGLYPTSLVRYRRYYVFGIRGGVVAIRPGLFDPSEVRYFKLKE